MLIFRRCVALAIVLLASVPLIAQQPDAATKPTEPVDFRKLKEALPAELLSIKRTEASGEKNSMGGFKISQARGTYTQDADAENAPRIEVTITDYSGTQGIAGAMAAWAQNEIDRESDSGYERTTKVGDYPAYETYQNESKAGQFQVFVDGRFIIQVDTTNVPAEQLKKLGEELHLEKLAALK
ncbi:hypothetical protein BH09PLA1_BH09PLA1_31200 [soil metagenome]